MKLLTLKYAATCADKSCGAALPAGSRAKWYGRGRIYGLSCHEREEKATGPVFSETTGDYLRDPGEDAEDRWNETHA